MRGQNNVQGGGDMGALPDRLPGFQHVEDARLRAAFEQTWGTSLPATRGWHLSAMFEAMARGELTTLYIIGENPAQSEADVAHAVHLLEGLEHLVAQDIFLTATAERADVVLPAAASWCEAEGTVTNSERRVQRVRQTLQPPGQARDDITILCDLVLHGGLAFAARGTADATGSKLFCLSGCVARPGLYEVPFGTTLRELLTLAGGVRAGRPLQAVLLGGAAGTFVFPEQLDTPLTFAGVRSIGASLGSGVVMVVDDTIDVQTILLRIAAFFRDESCGQCVPCRVGTVRQEELLHRLCTGTTLGTLHDELALHAELGQVMRDASICGLGHTAANAIVSALPRLQPFTSVRHP